MVTYRTAKRASSRWTVLSRAGEIRSANGVGSLAAGVLPLSDILDVIKCMLWPLPCSPELQDIAVPFPTSVSVPAEMQVIYVQSGSR